MADPAPAVGGGTRTASRPSSEPSWGLGDAAAGWLLALVCGAVVASIVLQVTGYESLGEAPLTTQAWGYPGLWVGFVGIPIWVAAVKGNGWIEDFRVRFKPIDVPVGLVAGIVGQLVLVPLVAWPVLELSGKTTEDLSDSAQRLADSAVGPGGAILFLLIVGVGAPLTEELFYRGLVLRSFEKRFGAVVSLLLTSAWFSASHGQVLLFVPLFVAGALFGILAQRYERLGPAIFAHIGFNLTTAITLLWIT